MKKSAIHPICEQWAALLLNVIDVNIQLTIRAVELGSSLRTRNATIQDMVQQGSVHTLVRNILKLGVLARIEDYVGIMRLEQ